MLLFADILSQCCILRQPTPVALISINPHHHSAAKHRHLSRRLNDGALVCLENGKNNNSDKRFSVKFHLAFTLYSPNLRFALCAVMSSWELEYCLCSSGGKKTLNWKLDSTTSLRRASVRAKPIARKSRVSKSIHPLSNNPPAGKRSWSLTVARRMEWMARPYAMTRTIRAPLFRT